MKIHIDRAFRAPKSLDLNCQDAMGGDLQTGRVAVADGVSEGSFMSAPYAQFIVDTFIGFPGKLADSFTRQSRSGKTVASTFEQTLHTDWRSCVDRIYLERASNHQRSAWIEGDLASAATFAGLEVISTERPAARVFVVGDCFAFYFDESESFGVVTGGGDDERRPNTVRVSNKSGQPVMTRIVTKTIEFPRPFSVILCTDYIGRWIQDALAENKPDWVLDRLLRIKCTTDFLEFLDGLNRREGVHPDDATFMLLRIGGTGEDLTLSEVGCEGRSSSTAEAILRDLAAGEGDSRVDDATEEPAREAGELAESEVQPPVIADATDDGCSRLSRDCSKQTKSRRTTTPLRVVKMRIDIWVSLALVVVLFLVAVALVFAICEYLSRT